MHGFKTEIPLFVLKIQPNYFGEASQYAIYGQSLTRKNYFTYPRFSTSSLSGFTAAHSLNFIPFLQRIFEVAQKKPFYSSYVTRLKTYTSKERGVCAKTPNFQTAHQQLQFFLIGISKLIHTIIFKNILRHHYLLNILLAVYLLLLLEKSIAATIGKTGT